MTELSAFNQPYHLMKTLLTLLVLASALTLTGTATEPVNNKCPVCGKDVRLIFHSNTSEGKRVAFATAECKGKFDKTPGKYSVKPK
jgi:YHS domain-containing protein